MKLKNIIQRNLKLDTNYTFIDKCYIPLEYSGFCCANCGKPIANIATVKNENGETFNIGFDCLETLLLNNSLLQNSNDFQKAKVMIPKIIRFAKTIKQTISNNSYVTGLLFERPDYGDYFTFYWLIGMQISSNNNDYVKLKEMEFDFLIATLKNIFPKLRILIK